MSISLLYLHLDLTSLYLRKRALWGQTEISLLSWCSACPGAVRLYVQVGGGCGGWRGGGAATPPAPPLPMSQEVGRGGGGKGKMGEVERGGGEECRERRGR